MFGRARIVETIEDREGNLNYVIQIGRQRRRWFWRVSAERDGPTRRSPDDLTGLPTILRITVVAPDGDELVIEPGEMGIGLGGQGGPCKSRDEALSEALRLIEEARNCRDDP